MASMMSVDGLDLSAIRLFLTVVELGSLSKAAARHGITQPSATAKLHKLERALGLQLLERGPAGSVPTEAGARVTAACGDLLASAAGLLDRAGTVRAEADRLVVAATRHVAEHFLPGWVAGFAPGAEGVAIEVREDDTLGVATAVRAGEAAIGFTDGPAAPLGLRSTIVAEEELVAVVAPGHPWAGRRRAVTIGELSTARVVTTRRGSGTLDVVEHALASSGAALGEDRLEVDGWAAVHVAVLAGGGVGFLARCRVAGDLAAGRLAAVPVGSLRIVQPVRLVWRGSRPRSGAPRRFVDAVLHTVA
jgi:DNA-binding transcriptional LysR family regulator